MKEPGDRYHLGIDWYAGLEYLGSLGVGRRSVLVVSVEWRTGAWRGSSDYPAWVCRQGVVKSMVWERYGLERR